MIPLPLSVLKSDHNLVANIIANIIHEGSLALVLGAGVSRGLGFPTWENLVVECAKIVGIENQIDVSSDTKIRESTNTIERKFKNNYEQYLDTVHQALYKSVSYSINGIIKNELLIALGALSMPSARGSVDRIYTLNFDNALEWYLFVHGFKCNVVTESNYIERNTDLTIYHPHGFLPKDSQYSRSKDIIFSAISYDRRAGQEGESWRLLFKDMLRTHFTLFVGLSGADPELGPAIINVKENFGSNRSILGFWITQKGSISDEKIRDLEEYGLVPILFDNYADIPIFLLKICQIASEL